MREGARCVPAPAGASRYSGALARSLRLGRADSNPTSRHSVASSQASWSCPDLADRFDCLNQVDALVSNSIGDT